MAVKNRALYVLKYIWDNSDEEHQVTAKDIIAYLKENDISATSRTVKADVEQLIEFGIEIEINHSTQNRFFMYERNFEFTEIKLLIDAVQSARFITENKSDRLINKLSIFTSKFQKNEMMRQLYVDKRIKTEYDGGYYTVDLLHSAILSKKKVTFKYIEIASDKTKKEKHNGQVYVFSPYSLVWNEDCYYVIGYSEAPNHNKVVKFRVERIKALSLQESVAVHKPKEFNVEDYFSKMFSMYDGPQCVVDILCENEVMNHVIDKFGEKVNTRVIDSKHFLVTSKVSLSPTFYGWLFSFAGKMKLMSPPEAVDGLQRMISKMLGNVE